MIEDGRKKVLSLQMMNEESERKMSKEYYLISIDPAGIGSSGIIIIDLKTWKIIFKDTFESETVSQSIMHFNSLFMTFNFKENIYVWVEDFYLSKNVKITNPLATAKLIGALETLTKYIFGWNFETYLPGEKNKYKNKKYQGNMKLSQHEEDAWIGAQRFKEKKYDSESFKNNCNS